MAYPLRFHLDPGRHVIADPLQRIETGPADELQEDLLAADEGRFSLDLLDRDEVVTGRDLDGHGDLDGSLVLRPNHRSIRDSRNGKTTCIISADMT